MDLDVRYAKAADGTHVAYAVLGDGPIDLVFTYGWLSNLDDFATRPDYSGLWAELASFARLIVFDRRGCGLSDRPPFRETGTLEAGMDDIRAVMDAVGGERALVVGCQDGGMLCALFAASHPDRTLGLVLYGSSPRGLWAPDFPWTWKEDEWDGWFSWVESTWGTIEQAEGQLAYVAPDQHFSREEIKSYAMALRTVASPGAAVAVDRIARDLDIRPVLPAIRVPTLVLHAVGDRFEPIEAARYTAEAIPGAKLVELPGSEHIPLWQLRDRFVEEVRSFASMIAKEEAEFHRVLATVMFTDIVGSTERAAELGDREWTNIVEKHHATVRAMLARYHGVEIDTAGDGFFATFDGPVRAVRCAQQIMSSLEPVGLRIRAGIHTGEVQTINDKVGGLGVTIGARVGAHADASQVLVSQTVKDLVAGSELRFEDAGEFDLKGVPDRWRLFRVAS